MKKICIIGLGYIGLPTGCILASKGYKVVGVNRNKNIVDMTNRGKTTINEPGLKKLLKSSVKSKNLIAKEHPEKADIFLITISVDLDKKKKKCKIENLVNTIKLLNNYIKKGNLIILESTVTPGTTKNILIPILEKSKLKVGKDIFVAYCHETAFPGNLIKEIIENDRVIGSQDGTSARFAKKFYSSFITGKIHLTDITTAEIVKLIENTYRDVNIALANEFKIICEKFKINIWEAIRLANKHPRVKIESPGPGVGGYCIPKDPWFIYQLSPKDARIIKLARKINESQPSYIIEILKKIFKNKKTPKISVFGVSYKGNVSDIRESPTIEIIKLLQKNHFKYKIFDPIVKNHHFQLSDFHEAIENSNCILIVTDHDVFKKMKPKDFNKMNTKIIFDTRNILDSKKWIDNGFVVY